MRNLYILAIILSISGCGKQPSVPSEPLPPTNTTLNDGGVVKGRAIYQIDTSQSFGCIKLFESLFIPKAYAATGSSTVTYTNAASVSFSINVASFGANGFNGDTLDLGSISLSGLSDNNLKICGVGGNQKCTQAIIRMYTTGSIAGFVHVADQYGMPVYAGSLNPSSSLGLNIAGSVQVQIVNIPVGKNKLRLSDFSSPTYAITSDFYNAGSGNYSMSLVTEYVLF